MGGLDSANTNMTKIPLKTEMETWNMVECIDFVFEAKED